MALGRAQWLSDVIPEPGSFLLFAQPPMVVGNHPLVIAKWLRQLQTTHHHTRMAKAGTLGAGEVRSTYPPVPLSFFRGEDYLPQKPPADFALPLMHQNKVTCSPLTQFVPNGNRAALISWASYSQVPEQKWVSVTKEERRVGNQEGLPNMGVE